MQERRLFIFTRPIIKLETPSTGPSGARSEEPMEIMVKLFVCSRRICQHVLWERRLGSCCIHIDFRRISLEVGWNEVKKLKDDTFNPYVILKVNSEQT